MDIKLRVWRQAGPSVKGRMVTYAVKDISPDASFLEMLDVLNERLILDGEEPIAFDHDCREGICGMCGMMINGEAHGPRRATTACQLHMRSFRDGDAITIEPWRADAFPVVKDLVVERTAFDRIVAAGGFISVPTGSAPDGNAIPVPKTGLSANWSSRSPQETVRAAKLSELNTALLTFAPLGMNSAATNTRGIPYTRIL